MKKAILMMTLLLGMGANAAYAANNKEALKTAIDFASKTITQFTSMDQTAVLKSKDGFEFRFEGLDKKGKNTSMKVQTEAESATSSVIKAKKVD